MARVADVHDRLVSQLYQRNAQLAQEKAEAELRLRQAAALLAELQELWMDLPPKVAASVSKVLARQGQSLPAIKDVASAGSPHSAHGWKWLSFSIEDVFGCAAPRATELPDDQPLKRPPPGTGALQACMSARGGSAEAAGGPPQRDEAREPLASPGREPVLVSLEPAAGSLVPAASPVEVGDLLFEAPGASALVAEIDVLCRALRKDAERGYEELNERLTALKTESQLQQQRLEENYRRMANALTAELDLCKTQLEQLTENLAPRFSLARDPQPELCDAEWAWCQRAAELRAQAGQAHVEWLEDCLEQRFQVAEAQLAAREREFQEDLATVWERKSLLTSRLRGRMTVGIGDGAAGGHATGNEELDHLKKALVDLEASAMAPLRVLADSQCREEVEHVKRLKMTIAETRVQCKAVASHLGNFTRQCEAEMRSRIGSSNATLVAHGRLERRHLVTMAFSAWAVQRLEVQLAAAKEELSAQRTRGAELEVRFQAATEAHKKSDSRLQRAEANRSAVVQSLCKRLGSRTLLVAILRSWTAQVYETAAGRHELAVGHQEPQARSYADESGDAAPPSSAEVALSAARKRAERRALLVAAFGFWSKCRLTARLGCVMAELEVQRAEAAELATRLQSTEAAVGFKLRRGERRMLVAALHSWAAQGLRRMLRRNSLEVTTRDTEADTRWADIRSQVMQLLDAAEGAEEPSSS